MRCELAGEIGNSYSGQLIAVDYVIGLTSASLTDVIVYGTEEEKDDFCAIDILQRLKWQHLEVISQPIGMLFLKLKVWVQSRFIRPGKAGEQCYVVY